MYQLKVHKRGRSSAWLQTNVDKPLSELTEVRHLFTTFLACIRRVAFQRMQSRFTQLAKEHFHLQNLLALVHLTTFRYSYIINAFPTQNNDLSIQQVQSKTVFLQYAWLSSFPSDGKLGKWCRTAKEPKIYSFTSEILNPDYNLQKIIEFLSLPPLMIKCNITISSPAFT